MITPMISILRSGDMSPRMDELGWYFFRDEEARTGCEDSLRLPGRAARERPPRPEEGEAFLREEDFERVIGMAKLL